MMWQTGEPSEQGWYLCAWRIATWDDFFVYEVGKWEDKKWKTRLGETPDTWKVIESPQAQNEMLENLYQYAQ